MNDFSNFPLDVSKVSKSGIQKCSRLPNFQFHLKNIYKNDVYLLVRLTAINFKNINVQVEI